MAQTVSPGLARFRMILWALVLVAAVAATALFLIKPPSNAFGVTGKPFTLESTAGGTFTQADLKGTPSLVFFGYTNCPDVCPTTLSDQTLWRQDLKIGDKDLRTIFVTVDPARDTKAVLTDYLSYFPGTIGLVGSQEQTDAAKASFGVFSENQKADGSGFYLVNHTANVFLIDKNGQFEGTIAYGEDKQTAEGKIKKLLAS